MYVAKSGFLFHKKSCLVSAWKIALPLEKPGALTSPRYLMSGVWGGDSYTEGSEVRGLKHRVGDISTVHALRVLAVLASSHLQPCIFPAADNFSSARAGQLWISSFSERNNDHTSNIRHVCVYCSSFAVNSGPRLLYAVVGTWSSTVLEACSVPQHTSCRVVPHRSEPPTRQEFINPFTAVFLCNCKKMNSLQYEHKQSTVGMY